MNAIALGWDVHRKFSQVSVQRREDDGEIRVIERIRLEHADREAMRSWLARLDAGAPVAMEGAFGWQWIADLLAEVGLDPHLGHPPAIKVLAKNEAKGDRCDADRLGRFYLKGIFPESYLATVEVRQLRERIRYRTALVGLRTGVKNRIQALLHRLGLLHDYSDLFGKRGRAWLSELQLPEASRAVLDGQLQLMDLLTELIQAIEAWMKLNLEEDEIVRLLQTIPGIGLILAHVIRAEIGEQPVLQPQLALGLDRGGQYRFAQPPSAGTTAALIRPAFARRPRQQGPGPRGRGPRIVRTCVRHLEEGRSLL